MGVLPSNPGVVECAGRLRSAEQVPGLWRDVAVAVSLAMVKGNIERLGAGVIAGGFHVGGIEGVHQTVVPPSPWVFGSIDTS